MGQEGVSRVRKAEVGMPASRPPGANGPLLSVTVCNYNYAQYLPPCLDSILAQSFRDFEVIVVDDASKDDSLAVIEPYLQDPRVRLIQHQTNAGVVRSLIEGTKASSSRYLSVISADDFVLSERAFERQIALLEANPSTSFCYAAWQYVDIAGRRVAEVRPWPTDHAWTGEREFRELCTRYYVLHSGTVIRRRAYDEVGGYDSTFRYTHDNTLWVLLCGVGDGAYVAEPLYGYRTHGSNMSHSSKAARATVRERLGLVEHGFDQLPDCPTKFDRSLRRRARQAALAGVPTMFIFGGKYWAGWQALAYAAWLRPTEALFQRRVVSLLARTVLGAHGFALARAVATGALRLVRRRSYA